MKNFGLVSQILNGVGLAEFPLNNLGSSPKVVEDFGQEALALTQPGEEEKALNGHGYQAKPLQGSGQKPILVNVKKVKQKLLVSYKVPTVYVSETVFTITDAYCKKSFFKQNLLNMKFCRFQIGYVNSYIVTLDRS